MRIPKVYLRALAVIAFGGIALALPPRAVARVPGSCLWACYGSCQNMFEICQAACGPGARAEVCQYDEWCETEHSLPWAINCIQAD